MMWLTRATFIEIDFNQTYLRKAVRGRLNITSPLLSRDREFDTCGILNTPVTKIVARKSFTNSPGFR